MVLVFLWPDIKFCDIVTWHKGIFIITNLGGVDGGNEEGGVTKEAWHLAYHGTSIGNIRQVYGIPNERRVFL